MFHQTMYTIKNKQNAEGLALPGTVTSVMMASLESQEHLLGRHGASEKMDQQLEPSMVMASLLFLVL